MTAKRHCQAGADFGMDHVSRSGGWIKSELLDEPRQVGGEDTGDEGQIQATPVHSSRPVQALKIPEELVLFIVGFLENSADVARLCRASRVLYSFVKPVVYRNVMFNMHPSDPPIVKHLQFYKTPQGNPSLADIVTAVNISTIGSRMGSHITKYTRSGTRPKELHRCPGSNYDEELGTALTLMGSLQVLRLFCDSCPTMSHGHPYLNRLRTRSLRELEIMCRQGSQPPLPCQNPTLSILPAPCLEMVTSLRLYMDLRVYLVPLSGSQHQSIRNDLVKRPEILPNLQNLCLTRLSDSHCDLISTRKISRLCIESTEGGFPLGGSDIPALGGDISRSAGNLTHLFMLDIERWLHRVLKQGVEPYLHLTHIGTVMLRDKEGHEALETMKTFSPLRKLQSVEIHQFISSEQAEDKSLLMCGPTYYTFFEFAATPSFLKALTKRHNDLKQVVIRSRCFKRSVREQRASTLWARDRSTGEWSRTSAPPVTYWKILSSE